MPQLSEKQLILAIAAGGVLFAGASFGGVYYVGGLMEEETAQIAQIDTKIRAAEKKKARIPKDETAVIILRQNVSEYVKILPEEAALTNFARRIQDFATSSGVQIRSLTDVNSNNKAAFRDFRYKIALRGSLWQVMRFMNSFETFKRFVRISDFAITAGKSKTEGDGQLARHDVQMTVQSYVYNPGSGGAPVEIPNYNRKRDRLREEIFKARAEIRLDNYAFKGDRARRDVFVDPRIEKIEGGKIPPKDVWTKAQQKEEVEKCVDLVTALIAQRDEAMATPIILVRIEMLEKVKRGMAEVKLRIDKNAELQRITYPPLKTRYSRQVLEPFAALDKSFAPGPNPSPGIPYEELVTLQEEMERYLIDGRLQDAKSRFQVYIGKLDEFKPNDKRYEVARILKDLHKKTSTALEFTGIQIKVSGVILQESGLSAAIINGKTYQEGDAIGDQLFLKSIGPEMIEFLYKGVVIAQRR